MLFMKTGSGPDLALGCILLIPAPAERETRKRSKWHFQQLQRSLGLPLNSKRGEEFPQHRTGLRCDIRQLRKIKDYPVILYKKVMSRKRHVISRRE